MLMLTFSLCSCLKHNMADVECCCSLVNYAKSQITTFKVKTTVGGRYKVKNQSIVNHVCNVNNFKYSLSAGFHESHDKTDKQEPVYWKLTDVYSPGRKSVLRK